MSPILVSPLVALAIASAWSPRESSAQQTTSASPDLSTAKPTREDFAKQIDIGGGRKMYLECRGSSSPTVVLVAGLKGSAEDWNITMQSEPTVFAEVAKFTRVCAYDRPGTPVGEKPSRSDPVPQPTTAGEAVADLHALLSAAGEAGPYVLVGHS
jgi:pimeloyl-ACP methyl ester carboxylesterase